MIKLSILFSITTLIAIPIDTLAINGNIHTSEKIILREIKHPIPGEYQDDIALEDRNRLYNLGIFSSVDIYQFENAYKIELVETNRYLPLPLINIEESKGKEGYSFGLALRILNFRGLNEDLIFGGMFGERDIYFINFRDPWISGDHQSFQFEAFRFMNERFIYENEVELPFDFISNGFNLSTGFFKTYKHKFNIQSGFIHNSIDSKLGGITYIPTQTKYDFIPIKFDYSYDTRDIYNDPESGIFFNLNPQFFIGLKKSNSYSQIFYSLNNFKKVANFRDIIFISKLNGVIKSGKDIPVYNREYLGGEDYVRGYSPFPNENPSSIREFIQVNNVLKQSLELQWTLTPKKLYGSFEFGIDQVLFLDAGFGSMKPNDLFKRKPIIGFGAGFRFFISGMGVISMDFGFNPYGGQMQLHMTDSEESM